MNDYSQPDFYRFNRDSLELVKWIKAKHPPCQSILDLGAGCGVMGIELANFYRPSLLELLELQVDYKLFLEKNLKFLPSETNCRITFNSFSHWKSSQTYDLIVCNPPYYLPGEGQMPLDERRGLARTFIKDDWKELLKCISRSLSENGSAYLVVKNLPAIMNQFKEAQKLTQLDFSTFEFEDLVFVELTRLDIKRN